MNKVHNNWDKIKLKDICDFINGDAYKDTDWSSKGIPIVRIQNLNNKNKPFNYWSGSIENKITINNGNLLLAWSGTPGTSFGAHIWNRGFALLNQHIFLVIYDEKKANSFWLKYAINQILDKMIEKSHGAVGLRHVTKSDVENLEILLPPINEQERLIKIIETKLTAVEKAKKANAEQIKNIEILEITYFQKLYNDYSKYWQKYRLDEISQIIAGQSPKSDTYNFNKDNLPFYQGKKDFGNVSPSPKVWCSNPIKIAEKNDVLLSVRAPVGPTNIANEKCCIGRGLCAIRANKDVDYKFLYYYFNFFENYIWQNASGSIFQAITIDDIKNIEISLPTYDEQKRIVNIIGEKINIIEIVKKAINEQSAYINALSQSIFRKAFNGDY
jgi:type I restriction enzyme S subunit